MRRWVKSNRGENSSTVSVKGNVAGLTPTHLAAHPGAEDTTLAQLHTILQIVMGWEDYHLHEFVIARRLYSVPDPDDIMNERNVVDESHVPLGDVVPRMGTEFAYLYDFGDSWEHDLILEAILLPEKTAQYPACIGGERNTPPEDVGGIPGVGCTVWQRKPARVIPASSRP
jgi:Plasmid pRiA4b ORF-3-like protein